MIHLLNTSIIPSAQGAVRAIRLETDLGTARSLVAHYGYRSHVGHQSTADILSALLGVPVPMDRTPLILGDEPVMCLVLQLRGRPPEGRILSAEEIEAIGYDLHLLIMERVPMPAATAGAYLGVFRRVPALDREAHGAAIDPRERIGSIGTLPESDAPHVALRGSDTGDGSSMIAVPLADVRRLAMVLG